MKRKEAVALVKELSESQLIKPSFLILNRAEPDRYKVQIKGEYDCKEVELFLKDRGLAFEENKDYLMIFKP